jgi:O-antigen/teichoic acid export membrane protein
MANLSFITSLKTRVGPFVKTSAFKSITGLAGGNLLGTILGVVGSLVQARFVTPGDLGYFKGFSIYTGYAFFLHMGMFEALQRYYPYYIGRGEKDRAVHTAEICQAWHVTVSLIVGGAFGVLAIGSLLQGNWRAALGWLVQVIAITSFIYGGFLSATYRSGHDFIAVAKGSVLSNTLNLFTLPVFLVQPYIALALRSGFGSLINLVYLHIHRPLHLRWHFSLRETFGLIKEGIPIFAASYAGGTLWSTVETTLILHFLGEHSLGYWSLSFTFLDAANKFAQATTAVYIPRITEEYGRSGNAKHCMKLLRKPIVYGSIAMLLFVVVVIVILPYIVPVLMPNFIGAIPIMALMLFTVPLTILELPYFLLVAMGKLVYLNVGVFTGLIVFVLLALGSIFLHMGLPGIVVSSLLGRSARIIISYMFVYRDSKLSLDHLKFM